MQLFPAKPVLMDAVEQASQLKLAYFAHEASNEGIRRRLNESLKADFDITLYAFRRPRTDRGAVLLQERPNYRWIDLGELPNIDPSLPRVVAYTKRFVKLLYAIAIVLRNAKELRRADVIVARGLDISAFAMVLRFFTGSRAAFVYEVVDVHRQLTLRGQLGWFLRVAERVLLKFTDLLLISSPGYLNQYFTLHYPKLPRVALIENKISVPIGAFPPRKAGYPALDPVRPKWVIGYFGKLRCKTTLRLLTRLARERPEEISIYIRGYPDGVHWAPFLAESAALQNVIYEGSYRTPDDLPEMMEKIHFNWCMDLRLQNTRSAHWLLPNRLYEGGYFAVPALGLAGTETGRYISDHGLGFVLPSSGSEELSYRDLLNFFTDMNLAKYQTARAAVMAMPPGNFIDDGSFATLISSLMKKPKAVRL